MKNSINEQSQKNLTLVKTRLEELENTEEIKVGDQVEWTEHSVIKTKVDAIRPSHFVPDRMLYWCHNGMQMQRHEIRKVKLQVQK